MYVWDQHGCAIVICVLFYKCHCQDNLCHSIIYFSEDFFQVFSKWSHMTQCMTGGVDTFGQVNGSSCTFVDMKPDRQMRMELHF